MKKTFLSTGLLLALLLFASPLAGAEEAPTQEDSSPTDNMTHNWEISSTDFTTIHAATHDITYWKNFMQQSRPCDVFHRLKTVVYHCDEHDHTTSETVLEEITHTEDHDY